MNSFQNMLLHQESLHENSLEFCQVLHRVASELALNPNWLMACMYHESKLDHTYFNPETGGLGSIQLNEAACRKSGYTFKKVQKMSNVEQLKLVLAYLHPYSAQINTYSDLYLAIAYPSALGKPEGFLLGTEDSEKLNYYQSKAFFRSLFGSGLRNDNHHYISKAEIEHWFFLSLPTYVQQAI